MIKRAPIRLLIPTVQMSFVVFTLCAVGVGAFIQTIVNARSMAGLAKALPNDAEVVSERMVATLATDFFITLVITLPVLALFAMIAMMKFIGPLARIRRFVDEVGSGDEAKPLSLRKGDEFSDWVEGLNAATLAKRELNGATSDESSDAAAA